MVGESYSKNGFILDLEDQTIGIIPRSLQSIFEYLNQKKESDIDFD